MNTSPLDAIFALASGVEVTLLLADRIVGSSNLLEVFFFVCVSGEGFVITIGRIHWAFHHAAALPAWQR